MIRRLYDWVMALAAHRNAPFALFAVAFAESSFFPIPPHAMLVPMILANREKAWWFATICTVGSVLGGLAGYFIGSSVLYELIMKPLFDLYGYSDKFSAFSESYKAFGGWIVFGAGLTPFPYKVITIASGIVGMNLGVFFLASVISRGMVFFAIAGLLYLFGRPIRDFIERRLGLVATVFTILLFGGFVAVKFLI
jgi:membrane protein YqaA with SNARE-associated domain